MSHYWIRQYNFPKQESQLHLKAQKTMVNHGITLYYRVEVMTHENETNICALQFTRGAYIYIYAHHIQRIK